ncbi:MULTISPECIES: DUF6993 domain-containing protein [unclassified Brevibacterium]|uniref:DUF6993 domain-containing protein n=1 Tax=unclassified Brevibacterium TaxID=2614124 RepID=UPI001BAB8734|nr:hypothetical protein [Brevibacterium sp. W7.2]
MRVVPLLGVAALTIALSGCSLLGLDDNAEPAPATTSAKPEAEVDKVIKAVEPLTGDSESVPSTKKFFDTMIDAGYKPEQLEATLDESPLGNEVPSKVFGVKTEKGCVVGEIRAGKATAELMPPSESTGACLLGKVDRPEGVEAPKGEMRDEDGDDNGAGHLPGENITGDDAETPSPDSSSGSSDSSGSSGSGGSSSSGSSSSGSSDSSGSSSGSGSGSEGSSSSDGPSLGGG